MIYEHILILGTGRLALDCAVHIKYMGLPCVLCDMNTIPSGMLCRQSEHFGIPCRQTSPRDIYREIKSLTGSTLLISAINPHILPADLLARPGLTAINCHQALLPRHPGRNAEMWAIFEEDKETGITWHYMTPEVDGGSILVQKSFLLTEAMTSFHVFHRQIQLAFEGFQEIIAPLLNGQAKAMPQLLSPLRKLHYSWEAPSNGVLNLSWSGRKISAFLRAMDYAGLQVMKPPRIFIRGEYFSWKKYKIQKTGSSGNDLFFTDSAICILRDVYEITLNEYNKEDYRNGTITGNSERAASGGGF